MVAPGAAAEYMMPRPALTSWHQCCTCNVSPLCLQANKWSIWQPPQQPSALHFR